MCSTQSVETLAKEVAKCATGTLNGWKNEKNYVEAMRDHMCDCRSEVQYVGPDMPSGLVRESLSASSEDAVADSREEQWEGVNKEAPFGERK